MTTIHASATAPETVSHASHVASNSTVTGTDELVTLVIPARNEASHIEAAVRSAMAQTYRNLQIIVVDGDSDDDTRDIVRRLAVEDPRVELILNPRRIIPVSLNKAVAQARGTWLVRLDAHAQFPADFVERAVAHLRTGRWGGVGGRKDGIARTRQGHAVAAAMASRFGVGNSVYHYGTHPQEVDHIPFGAYPLDVIRELGGWDEKLRVNQDFEFDYRVRMSGRPLLFDPALVIEWESRQSIVDLGRQYRRYGRGKAKVVGLHPASLQPRHLAAPALVVGLSIAAVVAGKHPRIAAGIVAPYVAGLGVATFATARKVPEAAAAVHLPGAFLAMHLGWGVGFVQGLPELGRQLRR